MAGNFVAIIIVLLHIPSILSVSETFLVGKNRSTIHDDLKNC